MKTNIYRVLLWLFVTTIPAKAILVSHLEDSTTRTWFSVSWGPAPFGMNAFLENGPLSDAGAIDHTNSVHVDAIHPFFTDSFDVSFTMGSRLFADAIVTGFAGVQLLPLPGDSYGLQVVYGQPIPLAGSVPEGGGTAALLAFASFVIWSMSRGRVFSKRVAAC